MAHIPYLPEDQVNQAFRVSDDDNILRIHRVHGRVMKLHYELYMALMHTRGPLSRVQREMIAVAVSARNRCHY